jgi:hypothetical protein
LPFSLPYRRERQSMAYQIYRIGEWERVGCVNGYSTIRACLQPGLYETEAYARKKAARSPTRITRAAATEAFRSLRSAKARSTTTDRRSPPGGPPIRTSAISTTAHSEEQRHDPEGTGFPSAPSHGHSSERTRSGATRYSADAVRHEIAKDPRIKTKPAAHSLPNMLFPSIHSATVQAVHAAPSSGPEA